MKSPSGKTRGDLRTRGARDGRSAVAAYLRVSTDEQTDAGQEREIREFCRRRGWSDLDLFRDRAGGARDTRPGLASLLAAVRGGRVRVVVVYKLDRLGRSLTHLAMTLAELEANKVGLVCTSQGIDTSANNPVGKLQLGVLMAVAEFERSMIRERTKAGLSAAKARGVALGRPPLSEKKIWEIWRLRDRIGPKVRKIARELGISASAVSKILRAEVVPENWTRRSVNPNSVQLSP